MNMFDEIQNERVELPKIKSIQKEVDGFQFNAYQKLAIVIFIFCIFLGVVFGNLFPVCGSSSALYSGACLTTEFNISLMFFIWFISFIVCLFIFMIGHVIMLLTMINKKMKK